MGDVIWYNISQTFKNSLLELLLLEFLREKEDNCEALAKRIQEKTGTIWLKPIQVTHLLNKIEKQGMVTKKDGFYTITANGREQISDRLTQMRRFIEYITKP